MIGRMEPIQTDDLHDELLASLEASGATSAADAYRIERVLKESSFEKTQLVYIRTLDGGELGPYVRKLINKHMGLGSTYHLLFDAQARGVRLRHVPRIVRLNDASEELEVVMEYVDGPSVRQVAELRHGEASLVVTGTLMPALCDAVGELHEMLETPVIHRDLTPSNVICREGDFGQPVLIDFAISRTWSAEAESDTTHFGTRSYAPPEQFGFGQTDVRSDVYALGMLAFFCLTGRDPYPADRTVRFSDPAVPEGWRKVIEKACELDPAKRYENVRVLRKACEQAAQESAAEPRPTREMTLQEPGDTAAATDDGRNAAVATKEAAAKCAAELWATNGSSLQEPGDVSAVNAEEAGHIGAIAGEMTEAECGREALGVACGPDKAAAEEEFSQRFANCAASPGARVGGEKAPKPAPHFFTVRNVIVLAACAVVIAASIYDMVDPSMHIQGSYVTNLFGFVVVMPLMTLAAAFLLLDKRWLYANVAWFKNRKPFQVWKSIFLMLVAVVLVWFAIIAICG